MQKLVLFFQNLNWTVRYKIGLAFILILVCVLINGFSSLYFLYATRQAEDRQRLQAVYLERLERYDLAYKSELSLYTEALFVTNISNIRDNFNLIIQNLIFQDRNDKDDPVNDTFEQKFDELYKTVSANFNDLASLARQGNLEAARTRWQSYSPNFAKINELLNDQRQILTNQVTQEETAVANIIFSSALVITAITLISILLIFGLLWLIERVIVRPLNKLNQNWQQVAKGDLNEQVEIINRDEVGQLAASAKIALQTLRQVFKGVQISENLRSVTYQLAGISKQQREGTSEQNNYLTTVTQAMQELGSAAEFIATSAAQVANLTNSTLAQIKRVDVTGRDTQSSALQMVEVVETTLHGVELVNTQVQQFSHRMRELNDQSVAVDKVVDLLATIASEIHLLSLNAAIEAAGAGAYGERFAVVAREVRALATRANSATVEARTIIHEVQASTRLALTEIESGQLAIDSIVQTNSAMRESLPRLEANAGQLLATVDELLQLAEQVSDQTTKIKQSTYQQHISSNTMLQTTHSLRTVTEQTALATYEISSSSNLLETLTNQLNGVLTQIKFSA